MSPAGTEQHLDGAAVSTSTLMLLLGGTFGGLLFAAVYIVEGATRPGHNAWADAVSLLSLGLGGWMQRANFVVLGVLTLCCSAPGWRLALRSGTAAMAIEGAGIVLVGFFSQDPRSVIHPGRSLPGRHFTRTFITPSPA